MADVLNDEYEEALAIADEAVAKSGLDIEELLLAQELRRAIDHVSRYVLKSRAARNLFDKGVGVMFKIAREVLRGSAGTSTPKDTANSVANSYVRCGFDPVKTRQFSQTKFFAEINF